MDRSFFSRFVLVALALIPLGCGDEFHAEIEIPESASEAIQNILNKNWQFQFDEHFSYRAPMEPTSKVERQAPRRQACDAGLGLIPVRLPSGELAYPVQGDVIVSLPDGTYRAFGAAEDGVRSSLASDPRSYKNFSEAVRVDRSKSWSLTAALTPGGHHVRLYLETEGRIKTMISEKDNFVKFHSEGSVSFRATDHSPLATIRPRDPNITVNDAGVFALTWDNRDPKIGPDSPEDATSVSPTFGLAFSVDGLNWTVYSNDLTIQGLRRQVKNVSFTEEVRHVVPVFLTNEQIRLYFSYGVVTWKLGPPTSSSGSCSLGTAVSN